MLIWAEFYSILLCHSITVGGIEDHVHIGCVITKKYAPIKYWSCSKKDSSKWLKTLVLLYSVTFIGKMDMVCFR